MRPVDADSLIRLVNDAAILSDGFKLAFTRIVNGEPTIEPEPHYDEWCTDCKEYDHERHCCPRWNKVIQETLNDALENAPTIEPERKTGKWKGYNADESNWRRNDGAPIFLICSECNGMVINNGSAHWNYCPNCGAYMMEEPEDIPMEYFESGGR